jgi:hypothetical protein
VDGNNGFRTLGDRGLESIWIYVEGGGRGFYRNGPGTGLQDSKPRRDEGVRWDHDFITGSYGQPAQYEVNRVEPAGNSDTVPSTTVSRELLLEGIDFLSEDILPGPHDPSECLIDLLADFT